MYTPNARIPALDSRVSPSTRQGQDLVKDRVRSRNACPSSSACQCRCGGRRSHRVQDDLQIFGTTQWRRQRFRKALGGKDKGSTFGGEAAHN
ncbi:hypothetical protein HPB52_021343 [Rhipicephalus sanguineus]|uniref:Uncharacterized protein n=1 Tax=Rhipicephalus sanguineus TaxID=34632 RepID=A0A9D4SNW8_RHISA|nr:hypothetical protein HPB52_021343 [Rhipicephalus sanguineus]